MRMSPENLNQDRDVTITLKMSQWAPALDVLSKSPAPWLDTNPVLSAYIKAANEPPAEQQETAE